MAELTLYGFPQSTYVRTARLACEEKGVPYQLEPVELGSAEHRKLHPFARIPAMRHGDLLLYETSAITRYVDRAFDGPSLVPEAARAEARMDQWISAINDYVYGHMIRGLVFERLVATWRGATPDEEKIAAALPEIEHELGVFDEALGQGEYLAGSALSLADLFLVPIVHWLRLTPEGERLLPARRNLGRWWASVETRPSVQATVPPVPESRAA